jgi:hypothetical protein
MKYLAIFVMCVLPSFSLFAQDKSNGCGMGWYFTKEKSILASSIRSSTNSVSPSSISMTLGTSGCASHTFVKENMKGLHFLETNFDHLRFEIAKGDGEYVGGFSQSLGCRPEAFGMFATTMRDNYDLVFPDSLSEPYKALEQVELLMKANPELADNCYKKS